MFLYIVNHRDVHYSDNLPYAFCEQIGKEIRDISDEIPFDIPDTWEWARCSTIGAIIRGSGIKRTETVESGMPCVRYGELYTTYNTSFTKTVSFVPQELFEQCKQIKYGDVLFTLTGENKPDIAKTVVYMGDETVAVGGDLAFWTHHGMNPLYLVYFMASPYTIGRKVNLATGDIIVHISGEKIGSILIPIPPLAEQDRIVAKIQELEPFINEYNYKNEAVSSLNTTFPEALKKSILQEAVQGKLVPQTPDDEPASVLLERIRAEKQALIKAGKIKKDKHESLIVTRDKIPYEIPNTWVWCRLADVFYLQAGKNISSNEINNEYYEGSYACYGGNGIRGYVNSYNRQGDYPIIGRQGALCGNINHAKGNFYATEHAVCVETFAKTDVKWACLFLKALNLNQYATATAQPGIAVSKINDVLIPLPPLAEQKRIVEKIEELMQYCDKL